MELTGEALWSIIAYLLIYLGVALLLWWLGKTLNEVVVRANGGRMPVVPNRPDDRENFKEIMTKSERHKWADEDTKLVFLADWINGPMWKECPPFLAYWLNATLNYNVLSKQKISIGDIALWIAALMLYTIAITAPLIGLVIIYTAIYVL